MGDLEKATRKAQEFRQRERQILDAALELFLEEGEDRVTVEMIADRVGIGKGTIYKHFETKNEIYLLLMLRYEEDLAEVFQTISGGDDKERLAREYFRFRISDPKRYQLFDRLENKVIKDHALPELVDKLHRIREANFARLTDIVKARIAEGSLEDVDPAESAKTIINELAAYDQSLLEKPRWLVFNKVDLLTDYEEINAKDMLDSVI